MEAASPARLYAATAGALLLVLGIVGFFYSASFGSPGAVAPALGVLRVNAWLNLFYAAVGTLGLLATSLGSRLVGACYVLDEPSIGLHSRDTGRLIRILEELRELGNTIVVVEHDPDVMRSADHIVDLGPGAGEHGGEIVFEGTLPVLIERGESLTAKYLRGELKVSAPRTRRKVDRRRVMRFFGARVHNLKNVSVEIPRDRLIVVTGLSGSGKSSLAFDTIYAEGQRRYMESLSTYAKRFVSQVAKPDVDFVYGLSPVISPFSMRGRRPCDRLRQFSVSGP